MGVIVPLAMHHLELSNGDENRALVRSAASFLAPHKISSLNKTSE